MESLSEISHTWKRLLITASILCCQIQSTSGPVRVVPNTPYVTVGNNVTLNIQGFSENVLSYSWYRKSVETRNRIGVYSVRARQQRPHIRERIFPNGSLLISNLTLGDIGDYIIEIVDSQTGLIEIGHVYLSVYELLSKPTINSTIMAPVEKMDNVSLTCQTLNQNVTFHWFSPKLSLASDRIKLSLDNRTLNIINVSREDQGPYRCEIRNPVSHNLSDPFTLTVTQTRSSKVRLVVGILTGMIVVVLCILELYYLYTRRCPCQSCHNFSSNENVFYTSVARSTSLLRLTQNSMADEVN